MNFKVVDNTSSQHFDIGSLVVLHRDDGSRQPCFKPKEFHDKEVDYLEDCWYLYFRDLEYVGEVVEQGTEQQKGVKELSTQEYTDKSIFKVVETNGPCFEVGDLVVIDSERSEYDARFKLVSEYGQHRKPYMNWLWFEGLEYVGELGEDTNIQENKDYRSISPDVLITISIDGNDFEVNLGSLVLLKKVIGQTNGSHLLELYDALEELFDATHTIRDFDLYTSAVDANSYSDDLFSEYFKPLKEKKELEQKREDEKKSLQSQIESLQEQLKDLD